MIVLLEDEADSFFCFEREREKKHMELEKKNLS